MTYADLVANAMKNDAGRKAWGDYLDKLQRRRDEEASIIKAVRKTHPGLARDEILTKYAKYLDNNFPLPNLDDYQDKKES